MSVEFNRFIISDKLDYEVCIYDAYGCTATDATERGQQRTARARPPRSRAPGGTAFGFRATPHPVEELPYHR